MLYNLIVCIIKKKCKVPFDFQIFNPRTSLKKPLKINVNNELILVVNNLGLIIDYYV